MKIYNIAFSNVAPGVKDCIWGKPVEGGFTLLWKTQGKWLPVKMVEDNDVALTPEDIKAGVLSDIVGTQEDKFNAANPFTLWALKDYIDSVIEANELFNPNVKTPKKSKK